MTINLGSSIDKVVTSINYTLDAFVTSLTLAANSGSISGIGNALDNILVGNESANALSGMAGNDSIAGGAGNDTLIGGTGNDTIDGGSGRDSAVYSGSLASYSRTFSASGLTIAGRDGTDLVTNVERLQFDDFRLAFDTTGSAGQAYRLYQAAFNRTPDIGGLGYQMNQLDIGVSLQQVASNFIASPEFNSTYGALDNTAFVLQLYTNVLHRAADAGGLAYHVARLDSGVLRSDVLLGFSESAENQANVIGAIQHGMIYTL